MRGGADKADISLLPLSWREQADVGLVALSALWPCRPCDLVALSALWPCRNGGALLFEPCYNGQNLS